MLAGGEGVNVRTEPQGSSTGFRRQPVGILNERQLDFSTFGFWRFLGE